MERKRGWLKYQEASEGVRRYQEASVVVGLRVRVVRKTDAPVVMETICAYQQIAQIKGFILRY